ncbi:MAG: helix-turn-helix transcriptional regulator [Clostridia bacterium]|nr:helix-turn-helix transcriptional regulator [Clostridia bacterium]
MKLSETIKQLRREREITQEDLAEMLGVSAQAVSHWECGRTMPDVTQLPVLANVFEVTTDELLGVDVASKAKRIEGILQEYERKYEFDFSRGEEAISFMADAYREFPAEFGIMIKYAWALYFYCPQDDSRRTMIGKLCRKILDKCLNDGIRKDAYHILLQIAETPEERREIAELRGLTKYDYETHWLIHQNGDHEKYLHYRQWDIIQKYWDLWSLVYWYREELTDLDEQIAVIRKAMAMDRAVFSREDIAAYADTHHSFEQLARLLIRTERYDEAMDVLAEAVENLELLRTVPEGRAYRDPLFCRIDYRNCRGGQREFRELLMTDEEFAVLREREDFRKLTDRLLSIE